ncbi:MAG: hypothetical protein ACM336_04220 [Acidobacteriota bacterium]
MTRDTSYESAKKAYTLYGWFLQEAAAELGWERAIAIQGRAGERAAGGLARALRARGGEGKLDASSVAAVLGEMFEGSGKDVELQITGNRVTGRCVRCALYDGLAAAGIGHSTIRAVCEALQRWQYGKLQQEIPELKPSCRFREHAGEVCIEEIALA